MLPPPAPACQTRTMIGQEIESRALTGITGGIAMFIFATMVKSPLAWMLSFVVFLAVTISVSFSGVAGAIVPLALKRFGG